MAAKVGNWQEAIDNLVNEAEGKAVWTDFKRLDSDESRVKYILSSGALKKVKWLKKYFDTCQSYHQKSHERSVELKNRGNEFFKKKEYKGAVRCYTESILHAPLSGTGDLSVAYGNRSAGLFYLGLYEDCLKDIRNAVEAGFSHTGRCKLEVRKCYCLFHLDQLNEALAEVEKLNEFLEEEKSTLDETKLKSTMKDVAVLKEKILQRQRMKLSTESHSIHQPEKGNITNKDSYNQSSDLQLDSSEEKGRFVTACSDIKTGDAVLTEEPFSSVLLPNQYDSYCHHCYITLPWTSIGCTRCSIVRYCSKTCQVDSWSRYHHVECTYLMLLHSVGIAHLSLRTVLTAGLQFLQEFTAKRKTMTYKDKMNERDKDGCYHGDYRSVYHLLTHSDHMTSTDLYQYSLTASLLLLVLIHSGWFRTDGTNNLEGHRHGNKATGEGEGHHHGNKGDGKIGEGHCHGNKDDVRPGDGHCHGNKDDEGTDEGHCHGNNKDQAAGEGHLHGNKDDGRSGEGRCDDNKERDERVLGCILEGGVLVREVSEEMMGVGGLLLRHILQLVCNAHAITDLHLTDSSSSSPVADVNQVRVATAIYPTASMMNHSCDPSIISSFSGRRLIVRAVKDIKTGQEIFNCYGPHHRRMVRRERQEILQSQYFFTCTCPPCTVDQLTDVQFDAAICNRCSGNVDTSVNNPLCLQCGKPETLEDRDNRDRIHCLFRQAINLIDSSQFKGAVKSLKECLKFCVKHLHGNNRLTAGVHDNLARCYSMMGNFREAVLHLDKSMAVTELVYGEKSVEVGHELQKMADILFQCGDCERCMAVVDRARDIFTILYGQTHPLVIELTDMRSHLDLLLRNT